MNDSIILFDGVCNLCNGFVQFVIARDKKNKFKFGSIQSEGAKKILEPFNFPLVPDTPGAAHLPHWS